MRTQVYTREMILESAYEVAVTEGFSELTARKIAQKARMSTQPIYLTFENTDRLRQILL